MNRDRDIRKAARKAGVKSKETINECIDCLSMFGRITQLGITYTVNRKR